MIEPTSISFIAVESDVRLVLASNPLSAHASNRIRFLTPLDIAYRAERDIIAERSKVLEHRPGPPESIREEGNHSER